jgi:hypothetical protein
VILVDCDQGTLVSTRSLVRNSCGLLSVILVDCDQGTLVSTRSLVRNFLRAVLGTPVQGTT